MKIIDRQAYFAKIDEKLEQSFSGTELQVARNIFKVMDSSYQVKNNYIRNIKKIHLEQEHLRDQDFFEPFLEMTKVLLGNEYYERFQYFIDHKYEYPYSVGYYRRPFRTKNLIPHIEGIFDTFSNLLYLDMNGFNLMEYLTTTQDSWGYNHSVSVFLAYELDQGNDEVFTALENIIFGENNTALLSPSMIKGILKSHNKKAHKMLGDLFLAARLQEGLRQSIVESMDEGSPEAAKYLLKIIIDHNLIRYSSILRGLAVWTGLNLDAMKPRQAQQALEYLYQSLTNSEFRNQGFESDNFNIVYISLWTTAFYEEEEIKPTIKSLMNTGAVYQKVAAQFFLSQSQNDLLRFELSHSYLNETDLELLYYLLENYCFDAYVIWPEHGSGPKQLGIEEVSLLKDKQERTRQFEQFKHLFLQLPKKEVTFESRALQGHTLTLASEKIAKKMLYLAMYDMDQNWLGQLIDWKDWLSSDFRNTLLTYFIDDFTNQTQRTFLFDSLSDKSMPNREIALEIIKKAELTPEELEKVETILKLKTGSLRQSAIQILLGLPSDKLDLSLSRLLNSRNELQRLGALEVMTEIEDLNGHVQLVETVKELANLTQREQVLLNKLIQTEEFTLENGFGLFDPKRTVRFEFEPPNISSLKGFLNAPLEKIQQLLTDLANLVHEHRHVEYEYSWGDGSKETLHIGENLRMSHSEGENLDHLPLTELWREFFNKRSLTPSEIIQIGFYLSSARIFRYLFNQTNDWEWRDYPKVEGWRKEFLEEIFPVGHIKDFHLFFNDMKYGSQVETIFDAYFNEQDPETFFEMISDVLNYMIHSLPEEKRQSEMKLFELLSFPWLGWAQQFAGKECNFDTYYKLDYTLYTLTEFDQYHRSTEELALAFERKLIDEDFVFQELLNRGRISYNHIRDLTWPKKDFVKQFPCMKEIRDKVVQRILEIELKRGDLPTSVTFPARAIEYFTGMEFFVKILAGLENETFVRGYLYVSEDSSKKEIFSHLLKNCYPQEGDSGEKLAEMLKGLNISEKRLLEAAMYAPQWLEIVENYLGWEGLKKAAWYFHAHINEFSTAEKEAVLALYSPITPQDFQDGAFDIDWFRESYEQVGAKRFQMLYQCAKYISGGANHRRSQLFADAVLGKLPMEDTKNEAHQKRNKDKILAYSLIRVKNTEDVLERYEFLQQFLQESKKFGAQRRTSEAKTVDIALENLARNAGYPDVIRLKWDMEAQKMETVRPFLEPVEMDDLTVQLAIDEYGMAEIVAVKNGKTLKSVPAKYNKLDYIVKLKELRTDLKNQFKRAKAELERSMMMESGFTLGEVSKLMKNPVLAPLLEKLVLKAGEHLGYFNSGSLKGCGHEYVIGDEDVLFIAHPVHLFESGLWSEFQRDLFARNVKQPFKQVFRELYLPNQDELATGAGWTRRYAGHQIQPKKAAALLKSRLWTANYEEGLQKVYYKENIVVQLYAMADWFSPSDIECPTLETVDFFDRNTFKPLEIAKIPKHIFSETMRDIDLVVSVAHVGGVDPEASLTTIEMRKAIVAESVRLMKLDQVRVEGNFALIEGSLGEYSVHLGSGNVYKQATGAIFIVPVHSQQRGRVFLPFLDEDPKTAEIVSKVLLLAEDKKIKDPFILEQIKS